ncbi:MAG: hypothetical protein J6N70_03580 [Oribacterium sp.]|nr:hypothetical protein [Oribacterium sp.]MBQ5330737.1 hypothetical protein [Oscillospiraceae bacterium]
MKDKTYEKLVIIITILGTISVAALLAYTVILYPDCSVISYIANKG